MTNGEFTYELMGIDDAILRLEISVWHKHDSLDHLSIQLIGTK